jgi:hypothetical protein
MRRRCGRIRPSLWTAAWEWPPSGVSDMRDFQFLVSDDRYRVPGLILVSAHDEDRARSLAERVLVETRHHRSIEVLEQGRPLFTVSH